MITAEYLDIAATSLQMCTCNSDDKYGLLYPTLYFPTNAHNVKKRRVIKTF